MSSSTHERKLEPYSPQEEIANVLTHGLGLILSIIGCITLLIVASVQGETRGIVAALLYGLTLVALYATSTLYHAFRSPKLKRILRIADHCSIFIFIAGTYSPFTLVSLQSSAWGWVLFIIIWSIALAGVTLKLFFTGRYKVLSTIVYVAMGWLALLAIQPLLEHVPASGMWWVLAGGLVYSAGSGLYLWKRLPFNHAFWHVCVLAGSICHYVAIVLYVFIR